jgi:hypothetical protein
MYTRLQISFLASPNCWWLAVKYVTYSYRFAEQVLNSHLAIKDELIEIIESIELPIAAPDAGDKPGAGSKPNVRPQLNVKFEEEFTKRGWEAQYRLFDDPRDPMAKIDFMKSRVGVEVAFSHASFLGIDLLKFQVLSYADLDKIDVGVYIVPTNELPRRGFEGSVTYDKVKKYLPHLRSAIQVPVWVVGLTP